MSLSTYADLKSAVAAWIHRSDLTAVIPDFIALAESDLRNDVRVQAMEQLATGTLTGETLAQPARFLAAKRLSVGSYPHDYVTPDMYQELQYVQATERVFTAIGQTLYILNGKSGDAYSLIYQQAFAPLSADTDTNWLLTNAPDVYLYAALRHAAVYLVAPQDEIRFGQAYSAAAARVTRQERQAAYVGQLAVRVAN